MGTDPHIALGALTGRTVVGWEARTQGLTHAITGIASFADGTTGFAKLATDAETTAQIRTDIALLEGLALPVMPRVLAAAADAAVLLIEDLSAAHWPFPYPDDLTPLAEALAVIREAPLPDRPYPDPRPFAPDWDTALRHAEVHAPELARWISQYEDRLVSATAGFDPGGRAFAHRDLWFTNVCFTDRGAVIVDWSEAGPADPWLDTSTINVDLMIGGREPLPMPDPLGWASYHLVASLAGLARGAPAGISHPERWEREVLELALGAAAWAATEIGVVPVVTDMFDRYRDLG